MIRRPPRSTRTDTLFPTRRSSDLTELALQALLHDLQMQEPEEAAAEAEAEGGAGFRLVEKGGVVQRQLGQRIAQVLVVGGVDRKQAAEHDRHAGLRSEEHTSELQSLMRISYAVFCLKKTNKKKNTNNKR